MKGDLHPTTNRSLGGLSGILKWYAVIHRPLIAMTMKTDNEQSGAAYF